MEATEQELAEFMGRNLADAAKYTAEQREQVARRVERMGNERMVIPGTKRYVPVATAREFVARLRALNA